MMIDLQKKIFENTIFLFSFFLIERAKKSFCFKKSCIFALLIKKGSIAQLVQSTCLTSRGSQVRILLFPQRSHRLLFFSRDVSSVGSERMLHTHEVNGSNPLRPTT